MQIALVAAVLATIVALARGGSLEALASTRFRAPQLLFGGLGLQLVFDLWSPAWLGSGGALAVVIASNLVVLAFLWVNRRLPGLLIAALGLMLNLIVIGANGAMPVSLDAIRTAGQGEVEELPEDLKHEPMNEDTIVGFLGDVIPLPGAGFVLSVGDLVLAAGISVLAYRRTTGEVQEASPRGASG